MVRVIGLVLLTVVLVGGTALATSRALTNRSGSAATGVTITFSEEVRITSYDETVFPTQIPMSRGTTFTFSGGRLENGAAFSASWTPSAAEIVSAEWESATAPAGTFSANLTKTLSLRVASAVSFSPDGRWLAVSGTEGGVCLIATQNWAISRFLHTYSFSLGSSHLTARFLQRASPGGRTVHSRWTCGIQRAD